MKKRDLEIVRLQECGIMAGCESVKEYMREHRYTTTFDCAWTMFYLGYINGKRAERAKKRK